MKMTFRNRLLATAIAAAFVSVLPLTASAEYRTFTSADGKTMSAELISATDSQATVKMESTKRTVDFPLSLLSEEDQDFVHQWAEENVSFNLRIAAKKKMTDSDFTRDGNKKTKTRSYAYGVSILNWGRNDLEDAMVEYRIYKDDGSYMEGNHGIELLASNVTDAFDSDGISLEQCETVKITSGG